MAEPNVETGVASALPDDVRESVAVGNLKSVGEASSVQQNIATANAVAHQGAMFLISAAATGKIVESIIATSPGEGGTDVAALQQLLKGAQTTPPVTAKPVA